MLQLTPQMRIYVATQPADFRCGMDGLARVCRSILAADPFSGAVFVFRNRRKTAVKILVYDGQGFYLCHKRMSKGRFAWWPSNGEAAKIELEAEAVHVLLRGGNPAHVKSMEIWRSVRG